MCLGFFCGLFDVPQDVNNTGSGMNRFFWHQNGWLQRHPRLLQHVRSRRVNGFQSSSTDSRPPRLTDLRAALERMSAFVKDAACRSAEGSAEADR